MLRKRIGPKKVNKGWGHELIWVSNDLYCGKILHFSKAGNKFSMHFHREKDETWMVLTGKFIVRWIDPANAKLNERVLKTGDVWRNVPCLPHQLEALQDESNIIEVSTPDSIEDNYRVMAGDSQNG